MSFHEEATGIYDQLGEDRIHPFIGEAFASPAGGDLRIVAVGINSYVDAGDWPNRHPGWLASWFRNGEHRFYPAVWSEAEVMAAAVASAFPQVRFRGKESIYVTNAVKVYVPGAEGKRSDQISDAQLDEYSWVWRAELDLMAKHAVLPHVVLVFGEPQWRHVWEPLKAGHFDNFLVQKYQPAGEELFHRCNSLSVLGTFGRQPVLLLRVTHPAARTDRWRAAELAAHPEFGKALAALA